MNGYIAFFNGKQTEVTANSSYEAQCKAIAFFNPPKSKRHMVHVALAEVDSVPYVHVAID